MASFASRAPDPLPGAEPAAPRPPRVADRLFGHAWPQPHENGPDENGRDGAKAAPPEPRRGRLLSDDFGARPYAAPPAADELVLAPLDQPMPPARGRFEVRPQVADLIMELLALGLTALLMSAIVGGQLP